MLFPWHRVEEKNGKRKAQVAAGAGALWGSGDAQASTARPRALFRFNGSHGFALAAGTPGRQPPPAFEGAVGRRAEQGTYEPRHRCSPPGAPAVIRGLSALPLSGSADDPLRSGTFLGSAAAQRARGASSRTVDSSVSFGPKSVDSSISFPTKSVDSSGSFPTTSVDSSVSF